MPPKKPALAIARGSESIPTPMFVFARLAIDEAIDALAALPGRRQRGHTARLAHELRQLRRWRCCWWRRRRRRRRLAEKDGTRPLPRRLLRADRAR